MASCSLIHRIYVIPFASLRKKVIKELVTPTISLVAARNFVQISKIVSQPSVKPLCHPCPVPALRAYSKITGYSRGKDGKKAQEDDEDDEESGFTDISVSTLLIYKQPALINPILKGARPWITFRCGWKRCKNNQNQAQFLETWYPSESRTWNCQKV